MMQHLLYFVSSYFFGMVYCSIFEIDAFESISSFILFCLIFLSIAFAHCYAWDMGAQEIGYIDS